jgi:hypothetical protein
VLEKEGEMLTTNLDRLRCGGERVQQTHRQEQSNARRESREEQEGRENKGKHILDGYS